MRLKSASTKNALKIPVGLRDYDSDWTWGKKGIFDV